MNIIDINDLDIYRLAVAKYVFLKQYREYFLIEDYPETNCILVQFEKETIIVALLGKPQLKETSEYRVVVFKQKASANSVKLSREFSEEFERLLMNALIAPALLLNEIKDTDLFPKLFKNYFEELYSVHPLDGNVFKHYATDFTKGDPQNRILGNITFVRPDRFNDPFDCQCAYASPIIADKFRVFCSIPINDNILMWSYYSNDHKGYCFEYRKFDIVDKMINSKINGLGIIGNVIYKKHRPKNKPTIKKKVSYSDLKFYIEATFSKYQEWQHEREYRFVIISDDFLANPSYEFFDLNVPVVNAFVGCKGLSFSISNGPVTIKPKQIAMSPSSYKLI